MKATWTIGYHKITIDTTKGTITGGTYPLRDTIKEEFDGITWDRESKSWCMDGKAMEARINDLYDYYVRVYNMDVIEEAPTTADDDTDDSIPVVAETKTAKAVRSKELVNRWDGFYMITWYMDGTKSEHYAG